MSVRWYILDEHGEATAVTDPHAFYAWERLHPMERLIALNDMDGGSHVSTVLLASAADPTRLPFETRVFGGPHDMSEWRWATRKEAEEGHRRVVVALTLGLDPKGDL